MVIFLLNAELLLVGKVMVIEVAESNLNLALYLLGKEKAKIGNLGMIFLTGYERLFL